MKRFCPLLALLMVSVSVIAYEGDIQNKDCQTEIEHYAFSWPISNDCDNKPRGGTSKGADVIYATEDHAGWLAVQKPGLTAFEKDRLAILAMAGEYRVDFNFLETEGFSEGYERDQAYHSWGTEYVHVLVDEPKFISLQHIMVMYFKGEDGSLSEPMVMKHWRQDWTYEDDQLFVYDHCNQWQQQDVPAANRIGRWSQAVFQVDDSPRYEAMGRWEHNPSFSTWISDRTSRPLPRREYSVRKDYQVLSGYNRHTVNRFGWVQAEENWKQVVDEDGEVTGYLAKEEGIGRYRLVTGTDFEPGRTYMAKTEPFWALVREAWAHMIRHRKNIKMDKQVEGVPMFMPFFQYADEVQKGDEFDAKKARQFIQTTLNKYIKES